MLIRAGDREGFRSPDVPGPESCVIPIGETAWPAPFPNELEFNAPVHGSWNIVHIGMLMPECHQIYVCADNCMRGVIMTAAEMREEDRFHFVLLEEEDIYEGNLEDVTIEGISDCLERLPERPPCVMVFLVCLHHFVGTNAGRVYEELERRFPDVCFLRCWMDPVMQKRGLTPDQKARKAMLDPLEPLPFTAEDRAAVLGDNRRLEESSDIYRLLSGAGFSVGQIMDCRTFAEYRELAGSRLFITRSYMGLYGMKGLEKRLGRPLLYMPPAMGYDEIDSLLGALAGALSLPAPDTAPLRERADRALAHALEKIGRTPIAIDVLGVPRPLGLARLLTEHGFRVSCVFLDAFSEEEKEDYEWLKDRLPSLRISATVHVRLRRLHGRREVFLGEEGREGDKVLAIGPKAAFFLDTGRFVNLVEMNGMWGYDGIIRLAGLMEEAFDFEKDTRDLVPRKGLGCVSCV